MTLIQRIKITDVAMYLFLLVVGRCFCYCFGFPRGEMAVSSRQTLNPSKLQVWSIAPGVFVDEESEYTKYVECLHGCSTSSHIDRTPETDVIAFQKRFCTTQKRHLHCAKEYIYRCFPPSNHQIYLSYLSIIWWASDIDLCSETGPYKEEDLQHAACLHNNFTYESYRYCCYGSDAIVAVEENNTLNVQKKNNFSHLKPPLDLYECVFDAIKSACGRKTEGFVRRMVELRFRKRKEGAGGKMAVHDVIDNKIYLREAKFEYNSMDLFETSCGDDYDGIFQP